MDKDLDKLFEETKESGVEAIERLNITISVSLAFMAWQIAIIIGILCLIFLDMAPVLRIIWMVVVFGYIGVLIIGSIVKLVKAIKTKNYVKTTAKTVEIIHDLISGVDSKEG